MSEIPTDQTRRALVHCSLLGLISAILGITPILSQALAAGKKRGPGSQDEVDWATFVGLFEARATQAFGRGLLEDEQQLQAISRLVRQLKVSDATLQGFMKSVPRKARRHPHTDSLAKRSDFEITLVTMEPGNSIPLHNHPGMAGFMACAQGKVDVKCYEPVGIGSSQPMLRRIDRITMERTAVTWLGPKHRNVHELAATEFTQLVDIFIPPYDEQKSNSTQWFALSEEVPEDRGLFHAKLVARAD